MSLAGGALLSGCMALYPNPGVVGIGPAASLAPINTSIYALPGDTTFAFDDTAPGATSGVTAGFSYTSNVLETHEIVFTLPGTFTFEGFTALGPAGTTIATYTFVGQAMTIPLRALTHDTAFADVYQDATYDPGVDVLIAYEGNGVFRVTLPNGGDDQPLSITASFDSSSTFHLLAGILANPAGAGSYDLQAAFTSVDPDNDGADDGAGTPPSTFDVVRSVAIACATAGQCDDGDACTTDTCDAGVCSHTSPDPGARLDCALGQLLDPQLCAPDPIVTSFEKVVQKKVSVARAAIAKLAGANPKVRKRLIGRIKRALHAMGQKAQRSRKLAPACRTTFGGLVDERTAMVDALSST